MGLALLMLVAALSPEVLAAVAFGAIGAVVGLVVGVEETAELFSAPAGWGHAGPILLTALGALILWAACVMSPVLPFSPLALLDAVVLSLRLVVRDRQRLGAGLVLLVAVVAEETSDEPETPTTIP